MGGARDDRIWIRDAPEIELGGGALDVGRLVAGNARKKEEMRKLLLREAPGCAQPDERGRGQDLFGGVITLAVRGQRRGRREHSILTLAWKL